MTRVFGPTQRKMQKNGVRCSPLDAIKTRFDESVKLHEQVFGPDHEWTKKARARQAAIEQRQVPPRWIDTMP